MKRLNIGCGNKIKKGWINLDIAPLKGVDVIHDLNKYPYPFKDNFFDFILADNVLEHLNSTIEPMGELYRILKINGKLKIIVPFTPSIWAFSDPTHKQFWTLTTPDYFKPTSSFTYYSDARFNILEKKIRFHPILRFLNPIINFHERIQKFYSVFLSGIIPAMMLEFKLKKI